MSKATREKRELLNSLDGQTVTLGIGTRIIVPRTGRVTANEDPFWVTFDDDGFLRAVPLADIRWIEDSAGQRVGGRW